MLGIVAVMSTKQGSHQPTQGNLEDVLLRKIKEWTDMDESTALGHLLPSIEGLCAAEGNWESLLAWAAAAGFRPDEGKLAASDRRGTSR